MDTLNDYAHTHLDTWGGWFLLLIWFAALIGFLGLTWYSARATVLALSGRLPRETIESIILASLGLVATTTILYISPAPAGLTLIAFLVALCLAAAGVGISLLGYHHSSEHRGDGPTGAAIVELKSPDGGADGASAEAS